MAAGERVELGAVERELGRARVVEEVELAGEALVAQRAQHRHDRRDAAAAADQQHALGARVGEDELALRRAQADDHPGARVVAQVARDLALGVRRHSQLDRAAGGVLRAGRGVGPRLADAVDLDAEAGELPGAQAAPVVVGLQREGDALGGLLADGRHLGAHVALDEQRADELDVAVDAVGVGEGFEQARAQDAAAEASGRSGGGHRNRLQGQFGVQVFTEYTASP